MNGKPLCTTYPILYDLCMNQRSSVREVMENEWAIQFKVPLPHVIREQWYELTVVLNNICLNDLNDIPI
jgi:hypothetical protein